MKWKFNYLFQRIIYLAYHTYVLAVKLKNYNMDLDVDNRKSYYCVEFHTHAENILHCGTVRIYSIKKLKVSATIYPIGAIIMSWNHRKNTPRAQNFVVLSSYLKMSFFRKYPEWWKKLFNSSGKRLKYFLEVNDIKSKILDGSCVVFWKFPHIENLKAYNLFFIVFFSK